VDVQYFKLFPPELWKQLEREL